MSRAGWARRRPPANELELAKRDLESALGQLAAAREREQKQVRVARALVQAALVQLERCELLERMAAYAKAAPHA